MTIAQCQHVASPRPAGRAGWILSAIFGLAITLTPGLVKAQKQPASVIFINELGDVPLMPGLSIMAQETVSFDTAAGRIVRVTAVVSQNASGKRPNAGLTRQGILAFYRRALPNLGWRFARGRFRREAEVLTIEPINAATRLAVRFSLRPANAKGAQKQ